MEDVEKVDGQDVQEWKSAIDRVLGQVSTLSNPPVTSSYNYVDLGCRRRRPGGLRCLEVDLSASSINGAIYHRYVRGRHIHHASRGTIHAERGVLKNLPRPCGRLCAAVRLSPGKFNDPRLLRKLHRPFWYDLPDAACRRKLRKKQTCLRGVMWHGFRS